MLARHTYRCRIEQMLSRSDRTGTHATKVSRRGYQQPVLRSDQKRCAVSFHRQCLDIESRLGQKKALYLLFSITISRKGDCSRVNSECMQVRAVDWAGQNNSTVVRSDLPRHQRPVIGNLEVWALLSSAHRSPVAGGAKATNFTTRKSNGSSTKQSMLIG